jgi:hypothetical protein
MTREEAIAYGKRVVSLGLNDETQAFCETAIKALEQQSCEDAISRQAAIRIASGYCHPANIADELAKLPPAQPETAHWIMPRNDDGMSDPIEYQVRCSKCGFDLDPQTWSMELHKYGGDKYCPKCGAKMWEGE